MSNKQSIMEKIKASFSGRKFRSGAYASVLSVVVVVIVLVVNLIITKLDIEFDLTASSKYSVTQTTKDILKELKDDITIYYMVQHGSEMDELEKIAQQIDKLSSKVELVYKDPVLYPGFGSDLVDEEITQNSFIVVNNRNNRARYVDYKDMIIQEFDYNYFTYRTTGTDAEGKLTSAILYVTNENLPNFYVVQGHQEATIPDTFKDSLEKMNVNMQTLETLKVEKIPEDCDILYINSPKADLNDDETKMIKDYLAAGGNMVVTVDYESYNLKNLMSILEYYGIQLVDGIVLEGERNMTMFNYPNYLLPKVQSHEITLKAVESSLPVYMPYSSGLVTTPSVRSTLTISHLLSTSDSAYSKTNMQSTTVAKEEGDIDGPFSLGILSTDSYKGVTSNLVVYSSEFTFAQETSGYANSDLLAGTVGYLVGDTITTVSIPAKTYGQTLIYMPPTHSISWGILTALGIPIIIFAAGAVICLRRRKK